MTGHFKHCFLFFCSAMVAGIKELNGHTRGGTCASRDRCERRKLPALPCGIKLL